VPGPWQEGPWLLVRQVCDADGKRRQPPLGPFTTEREAREAHTGALSAIKDRTDVSDRSTTLREYLDQWMSWREPELKPRTRTA
jgi:hypothetical protein